MMVVMAPAMLCVIVGSGLAVLAKGAWSDLGKIAFGVGLYLLLTRGT